MIILFAKFNTTTIITSTIAYDEILFFNLVKYRKFSFALNFHYAQQRIQQFLASRPSTGIELDSVYEQTGTANMPNPLQHK